MFYQRFSYKIATWQALNFILMVFEYSLLALGAFLFIYLRGKHNALNLDLDKLPVFAIYTMTSAFPLIKVIWLVVLYIRSRLELKVRLKFYKFLLEHGEKV